MRRHTLGECAPRAPTHTWGCPCSLRIWCDCRAPQTCRLWSWRSDSRKPGCMRGNGNEKWRLQWNVVRGIQLCEDVSYSAKRQRLARGLSSALGKMSWTLWVCDCHRLTLALALGVKLQCNATIFCICMCIRRQVMWDWENSYPRGILLLYEFAARSKRLNEYMAVCFRSCTRTTCVHSSEGCHLHISSTLHMHISTVYNVRAVA